MYKVIKDKLCCPKCHGALQWNISKSSEERIIDADIKCLQCEATYHVKDEIGVFLTPDLQRNDLWEKSASSLEVYFSENPKVLEEMEKDIETLSPADLWFLASYYENMQSFDKSIPMFEKALPQIYVKDYLKAWKTQMTFVKDQAYGEEHILDIASGKGYLVRQLLEAGASVMATDFSPTILKRNKAYYTHLGLYDNLSLMAFDAKRTPFKEKSVKWMTSNMGLQNVEGPGELAKELTRILNGKALFVSQFFQETDKIHMDLLKKYKMDSMSVEEKFIQVFKEADLDLECINKVNVMVLPTPEGEILEGAKIDGLPVEETTLTFATMVGRKE